MTSPNVSYFIPLGAIFLYAIVIAIGFPATGVVNRTIACNVRFEPSRNQFIHAMQPTYHT